MEEVQQLPDVSQNETKPVKQDRKKVERKKRDEKGEMKFMPDEFERFGENWIPKDEGETIKGIVQHSEDYPGDYGAVPTVLIGERRVLCGAGLKDLPKLEGRYVQLVYLGKQPSKHKGRKDWMKFDILVKREE